MKSSIRIGTRGSALALYQAEFVKSRINLEFPLIPVEVVKIKTGGDMIRRGLDDPLETKRIYTREIEDALLKNEIDIAVHSAKDMAAVLPAGLVIGCAFEREDSRDCLVSKDLKKLSELQLGARIGTSSLRRKMQLLRLNPELIIEELHGNVGTRIQKMEEGHYDAVVLAYAGIKRLGLTGHAGEIFDTDKFFPAPGQGIIAAEIREGDSETLEILKPLSHAGTEKQLSCEREFLKGLQGGCQLPCGIATRFENEKMFADGILFATEGHEWVHTVHSGNAEDAAQIGEELAKLILSQGGQKIMEKIRQTSKSEE